MLALSPPKGRKEHVFRAGSHQIAFRLKRRDKALAMATTTIQVQGGGDFGR